MFDIEKGVPVPHDVKNNHAQGGRRKYPFPDMDVWDSILVDGTGVNAKYCKAYMAAINYGRRNGKRFLGRREPGQPGKVRIWRVE